MSEQISSHRLFVDHPLLADAVIVCLPTQAHYLLNVLRLGEGALLPVFNGVEGEWVAQLHLHGRKKCTLQILRQTREQSSGPAIHYLFAPLKKARLDYMAQKATELGVASLQPVLTRRTNVARLKTERLEANIIEAAEQCGILRVPQLRECCKLEALLAGWDTELPLIFCDEAAPVKSPLEALSALQKDTALAVLVGPEGGFDEQERALLLAQPFVHALSLGPRIMRADTAAVAILALANAVLFDWR
ncbi:MAG: 16S rRNA (uracil(1498)-N(3))-methyltransferase [Hyphomicrobiaceae bacterium]|nr:16S rRNA (uracil(1498)-N(3))-methyltransferase [Hyphomicrobiaceae bacterium]